jgi:hypothetical protein
MRSRDEPCCMSQQPCIGPVSLQDNAFFYSEIFFLFLHSDRMKIDIFKYPGDFQIFVCTEPNCGLKYSFIQWWELSLFIEQFSLYSVISFVGSMAYYKLQILISILGAFEHEDERKLYAQKGRKQNLLESKAWFVWGNPVILHQYDRRWRRQFVVINFAGLAPCLNNQGAE